MFTILGTSGGSSGSTEIKTPQLVFVDGVNGNNGTAIVSRMDKPYATLQAAYAAGVTGAEAFTVVFMPNSSPYTLLLTDHLSGFCKAFVSFSPDLLNEETLVKIVVTANGTSTTNANATSGLTGTIALQGVELTLYARGGNVTVDDAGSYAAGSGGSWTIIGQGAVAAVLRGGENNSSVDGVVVGGSGGELNLRGLLRATSVGFDLAGGLGFNGGATGSEGFLYADGCDFRVGASISAFITMGRCSYTLGAITIDDDRGGNAGF